MSRWGLIRVRLAAALLLGLLLVVVSTSLDAQVWAVTVTPPSPTAGQSFTISGTCPGPATCGVYVYSGSGCQGFSVIFVKIDIPLGPYSFTVPGQPAGLYSVYPVNEVPPICTDFTVVAPITGTLILDPPAACQGATVQMAATYSGFTANPCTPEGCGVLFGGLDEALDLCTEPTYDAGVVTVTCSIVVPSDATCGEHSLSLGIANHGEILGEASAPLEVLCPCPAVGGCVQPVNTFALLSPWIVAIGLVGCIGTVVVVAKKRRP